jgi:Protein of unknown function (DUF3826)
VQAEACTPEHHETTGSKFMKVVSMLIALMVVNWSAMSFAQAPATAPTPPLTKTVGVDIVKMTPNQDGTRTLLFRWKDRQDRDVERPVILNSDTVIGIGGKFSTMADLTDDVIRRNKAVATVGEDMVTAVSLRVGRPPIKVTRDQLSPKQVAALEAAAPKPTEASNAAYDQRVTEWAGELRLNDPAREARVKSIILTHMLTVRDTHNAGFAPPAQSRATFNDGLKRELTAEQIEHVKDRITIGKLAFTMNGYRAIVPDLTSAEQAKIMELLTQAREESLDMKNEHNMSDVFDGYKKQIESYLIANGRDWRKLYREYGERQRAARATTQPAAD